MVYLSANLIFILKKIIVLILIWNEFVKGNLAKNVSFWEHIKRPEIVLITLGYRIPFQNTPKQAMFRNNKSSYLNQDFFLKAL